MSLRQWFSTWSGFAPPPGTGLETFLVVTTGVGVAAGISWVETRDAAEHSTLYRRAPPAPSLSLPTENHLAPEVNLWGGDKRKPALVYWPAEGISGLHSWMQKGAEVVLFNHLIMQSWAAPEHFKLGRWLEVRVVRSPRKPPRTEYIRKGKGKKAFLQQGSKWTRSHLPTVYKEPDLGFLFPGWWLRGTAWGSVWRGSEVIRRKLPFCPRLANQRAGGRCWREREVFHSTLDQKQDNGFDDGLHRTCVLKKKQAKGNLKPTAKARAEDERGMPS